MRFVFAFGVVVLGSFAGCAERAPRSFVQPNVLRKADLDGTWYYAQTIVDAPPSSTQHFIGQSSDLMKIRFEVRETQLLALRAYEWIAGSEDKTAGEQYAGEPLAGWPIQSQFDIIRDYNPATGEESNKIIESTERPWNEREFFRVDWSNNVVPNAKALFFEFGEDADQVKAASYWESDPTKPDAIHLERASEDEAARDGGFVKGEATYLDVTNKLTIEYARTTFKFSDGDVTVSNCLLDEYGIAPNTQDCSSTSIKVRHAFAKRSPAHDYEPRKWDGKQMDMFGLWDIGLRRLSYDRKYGVTNSGFVRHAARFNLWRKSYRTNDTGEKEAIPYAERELRTIPYYASSTSERFPEDLFEAGAEVIKQWNEAIKVAVADVTGAPSARDILVWCHNPVRVGVDPGACAEGLLPELGADGKALVGADGQPVLRARQGDPRRSHIFWVNQNQAAGPLGYGPPLFDPETGETLSGQAYIYGGGIDSYSARSRDLVLLLAGRIDPQAFIEGVNVAEWVAGQRGAGKSGKVFDQQQVDAYYRAMDFSSMTGLAAQAQINRSSPADFKRTWRERSQALYDTGVLSGPQAGLGQVRLDGLRGGEIEAQLVTPELLAAAGLPPDTQWSALSPEQKMLVSPLRGAEVRRVMAGRRARMEAFGVDFADFADEGIAQRAAKLAADPALDDLSPERVYARLRRDIFVGVTLHEVGHNVGLRHNFRGSYDALNYFPGYWQLREAGKRSTRRYAGWDPGSQQPIGVPYGGGATCTSHPQAGKLRPRYIDCPGGATSVEEVTGGVRELQYASIMDYGAEFNADFHGLGHYDKAAMKFAYAGQGYVEVFTGLKNDAAARHTFTSLQYSSGWGLASPLYLFNDRPFSSINYTSFPELFFDGIDGLEQRRDVPYEQIGLQGDLRTDGEGNAMVPYQFCADEFAGNLTCQRFDAGADIYEQSSDLISRYENHYLLNNFKRDRYVFSARGYADRIASRYLDPLRAQLTWFTLLRGEWADFDGIDAFFQDEAGWGGFTVAVNEGLSLLGRIVARPEAGRHKLLTADQAADYPYPMWRHSSDSLEPELGSKVIGLLDGKYVDTAWDQDNCGYYSLSECQTRVGYFYDKVLALLTLAESQAHFTGRDTSTDLRKYAIGYIVPYKHQLQEKLGALLAGDYGSLAPSFSDVGAARVSLPNWSLNDAAMTPRTDLIDPAAGFSLQLYAGALGLAMFPTTFDNSFIDTTRIFVIGNGEAPVSDEEILAIATVEPAHTRGAGGASDWLRWTDPESGKTYAAHSSPRVADGGVSAGNYRNDTGVRMLSTARALSDQAAAACSSSSPSCPVKKLAAEKFKQNLDVMRSLHRAFGYSPFQ